MNFSQTSFLWAKLTYNLKEINKIQDPFQEFKKRILEKKVMLFFRRVFSIFFSWYEPMEHLWAKVNNKVGMNKKTGSGFSQAYFWQVVWFPVSKPEIEESGLHRECFCCISLLICHMTTHQMTSIPELCDFFSDTKRFLID